MGWVIVRKDGSYWLKFKWHHLPPGVFLKA